MGRLRQAQEAARGGVSLSLPAQEVALDADGAHLRFEATRPVEGWNAQVSLLTGIVAASAMVDAGIGLLRTLPAPDPGALDSLRHASRALGHPWPAGSPYPDFVRSLDPSHAGDAALLHLAARTLRGAGYLALDPRLGPMPPAAERTHAAIAAPYAHVTAPLRRLADRHTNEVLLALFADEAPPTWATEALAALPATMAAADRAQRALERDIVDAMEALVLRDRIGTTFRAVVVAVDERGRATVQIAEPAVVGRLEPATIAPGLGDQLDVTLVAADVSTRQVRFAPR